MRPRFLLSWLAPGAISPSAAAILMVVLASAAFAGMHGSVRYLSTGMHPFEIAFFRNVFGFLVFVPWMMRVGRASLRTQRLKLHGLRAMVTVCSMFSWFTALSLMPLAEVTALSLAGPLFTTLGAILVFHERVRLRRWAALGLGAAGVVMIVRPGFSEISLGVVLMLGSSVAAAATKLMVKALSRTDSAATIVAYSTLLMTPLSFIPALFVWSWPSIEELIILALMGGLGSGGHYLVARAYRFADVSFVEPANFTRLIWAALFGFVLFAEVPEIWSWIGGGMIVTATSYIAYREAKLARGRAGAPSTP